MLSNPAFRLGSGNDPGRSASPPSPPSSYLRLPQGKIISAWRASGSPHGKRSDRPSPSQRAGLAYQRRVEKFLVPAHLGDWKLDASPWYVYCDDRRGRNYCQPDFVLDCGAGIGVVIEAKLRWTADAWYQLQQLYLPILMVAGWWKSLIPLCICKSFDPAIRVGEEVRLVDDIFDAQPGRFNVMVLR